MGLLNFVEQDDGIGMAAHLFGELPAFFVADVARRGADQPRNGVFLHVLGHVDANHELFVIKQEFRERTGEFGFSDAGRPQENERANGALGVG